MGRSDGPACGARSGAAALLVAELMAASPAWADNAPTTPGPTDRDAAASRSLSDWKNKRGLVFFPISIGGERAVRPLGWGR